MSRQARRKTDYGTIILHWLAVSALAVSVVTGLRIMADRPGWSWLKLLDHVLPHDVIWTGHFTSALFLVSVAAAYAAYLSGSGLTRRIRFDRTRLVGLFRNSRARWGAVNILLYWLLFLTLMTQLVTGLLLYLGYGGRVVSVHRTAMWIVLVYPVAHIAVHWILGGRGQLLRIFRPSRLLAAPPPIDAFELMMLRHGAMPAAVPPLAAPPAPVAPQPQPAAREPEPTGTVRKKRHRVIVFQTNPFVVALAIGLAVATLVVTVDNTTRDSLEIRRITKAQAPNLDGDISDPAWRASDVVTVQTQQGINFDGAGASTVSIRALHDGEMVWFAFVWSDPTRSLKHLPLIKKENGWHLLHEQYDLEDEDKFNEDKFSVLLSTTDAFSGDRTFHMNTKPIEGHPAAFSGRGLHYTIDGRTVDVWLWKAVNGGLEGWMDDSHFGPPAEPTTAEREGLVRYKGGYAADPGTAPTSDNFERQPPGGYDRPLQPLRLPKDAKAVATAMGRIDLDPDHSESDGARWWLTTAGSVPFSSARDAAFPVGSLIPGIVASGTAAGDRADLRCAARWASGHWTLEVVRKRDTGSRHDLAIASGTTLRVAAFDHSQTRHTRHVRPIRLEVE